MINQKSLFKHPELCTNVYLSFSFGLLWIWSVDFGETMIQMEDANEQSCCSPLSQGFVYCEALVGFSPWDSLQISLFMWIKTGPFDF